MSNDNKKSTFQNTNKIHHNVVDHTKNQNISDANRAYNEKIDQQRGINRKDEVLNNTYSEDFFKNPKESARESSKTATPVEDRRKLLHGQENNEKDYAKSQDNRNISFNTHHGKSINHTENKNISDSNNVYSEKTNQQRGGCSKDETPSFSQKTEDILNSIKTKESANTQAINGRKPLHEHQESTVDYTRNQYINEANRAYQEKVDQQRGIYSKDEAPSFAQKTEDILNSIKAEESASYQTLVGRVPLHGHREPAVDYTRNQNINEANRAYQEKVDKQRGIYSENKEPSFTGKTEDILKRAKTDEIEGSKNINNRTPLHIQREKGSLKKTEESSKNGNLTIVNSTNSTDIYYISSINRFRGIESEKIRNVGIDLSELYEKSAKGGEKYSDLAKTFGASGNDIVNLLETRNLKPRTNLTFKIGDNIKNVLSNSSTYLYETASANTDAAQGIRTMKKWTDPAIFMILDSSMMSMDKAMKKDLPKLLNKLSNEHKVFGNNSDSYIFIESEEIMIDSKELQELKNELIKKIEKNGNIKFDKKNPKIMQQQIRGYLRVNKHKLTDSEVGALKMLLQVAHCDTMEKAIIRKRRIFRTKMTMRSFRFLQQTDAGAGTFFIYNLIRRTKNTVSLGMKAILTTAKMVLLAGKLAYRGSAKLAAELAKTKLGQKVAQTKVGSNVKQNIKAVKAKKENLATKGKKTFESIRENTMLKKFKAFRDDPFGMRSRKKEYIKLLKNTRLGRAFDKIFSPFNFVKKIAGHAVSATMSVLSFLISVLMTIMGLLVGLILIIVLFNSLAAVIISLFDFSANEEEIQTAALEKIKSCYEAQNQTIESFFDGRYASVSVTYNDIRDEEEYAKEDNQPYEPFKQTTNSAEMLSMAQIYFDFDMEEAGKDKVVEYIEKLYNGSHLINLIEKPIYGKDEDGNEVIIETHAKVSLDTYYFNSIFQCELLDNSMAGSMGGVLAGNSISDQVWNYLRTAGFTEEAAAGVMGNLYQESGMDPTKLQNGVGPAAGLLQMEKYKDYSTRWGRMAKKAEAKGKEWTDLESQLEFLIEDMPGQFKQYTGRKPHYYNNGEWCWWPEKVTVDQFKKLTDIDKATEIFERVFLRASKPNMPRRNKHAHLYYETYHGRGLVTVSGSYINPCSSARVSSEFGPRRPPTPGASSYHNGIDLAAPSGTPILAANGGKVKKVVSAAGGGVRGNYIVIDHGNGMETLYQHMRSRSPLNVGDSVKQGQKIGEVGNTGIGTGPHLHFEVHQNEKPVNPRNYIKF